MMFGPMLFLLFFVPHSIPNIVAPCCDCNLNKIIWLDHFQRLNKRFVNDRSASR